MIAFIVSVLRKPKSVTLFHECTRILALYVKSNPMVFRVSICQAFFNSPIKDAIINMHPKTIYELENQTETSGFNAAS